MDKRSTQKGNFPMAVVDSLSGVYLWLFFGYLSMYINCDLQRLLRDNPYLLHVFGFFTFFFLFTIQFDAQSQGSGEEKEVKQGRRSPWIVIARTVVVYSLWVLAGKMKAAFIFVVLGLILCHQVAQVFMDYYLPLSPTYDGVVRYYFTTSVLVAICLTLVVGVSHYMRLQRIEYGRGFSLKKFFVDRGNCKHRFPDYDSMKQKKERGRKIQVEDA